MHRIAQQLIHRVASAALDKLTRVAILEGVLGVTPWSLARGSTFQLEAAMKKIIESIPEIDEVWLSDKDTGLYKTILKGAASGGASRDAAQDIAMDILGGFSRSKNVTGGQLYDVGKKIQSSVLSGGGFGAANAMLYKHARHKALSQNKGPKFKSLTMDDGEGGEVMRDIPSESRADMMDLLADFIDGPGGAKFLQLLHRPFAQKFRKAPAKLAVFEAWLKDPRASDTSIARQMGNLATYYAKGVPGPARFNSDEELRAWLKANPGAFVSPTYTARILREVKAEISQFAQDLFRQHPELLREVDLREEMGQLGYGTRAASELKAINKIRQLIAHLQVELSRLRT